MYLLHIQLIVQKQNASTPIYFVVLKNLNSWICHVIEIQESHKAYKKRNHLHEGLAACVVSLSHYKFNIVQFYACKLRSFLLFSELPSKKP